NLCRTRRPNLQLSVGHCPKYRMNVQDWWRGWAGLRRGQVRIEEEKQNGSNKPRNQFAHGIPALFVLFVPRERYSGCCREFFLDAMGNR
ncbi:hypothetical protein, partial [Burkholderia cenocepacia]|uniref:hypothetical protein n=2 Tax=Burkholderia cepacia complex TaxID=87882 RepID=UPI001C2E55FB